MATSCQSCEEISNVVEFALNECDQILGLLSTTSVVSKACFRWIRASIVACETSSQPLTGLEPKPCDGSGSLIVDSGQFALEQVSILLVMPDGVVIQPNYRSIDGSNSFCQLNGNLA